MTREEAVQIAEERNALGFEGDTFMRDKFRQIIQEHSIKTVVETGTYLGNTTKALAKWVDQVHTIELNELNHRRSTEALSKIKNVTLWKGNSGRELDTLIPTLDGPFFFFLDAHWESYNPLLAELSAIAKHGIKPVIAIHDFKVPGFPELGFDSYNGQAYDWDWIASSIEKIYGSDGYIIEYNSKATGAMRGIIYIYPNQVQ